MQLDYRGMSRMLMTSPMGVVVPLYPSRAARSISVESCSEFLS
jgi:hypothetical protein